MKEDTIYISNFLNFYNKNLETNFSDIFQYEEKLITILNNFSFIEKINFSDFVEKSYVYQYLILHENTDQ